MTKLEKSIERFSYKNQKGHFWAHLGPFEDNLGPFCTQGQIPQYTAYYVLTFSEEIRKKY